MPHKREVIMKKVGVVLSGCGFLDGAEITEAVSTLLALSQRGAAALCFAPNEDQHHVINHLNQEETDEKRNVLIESARIARGKIQDIQQASAEDLDALILPGGYGAAKNLCSFAFSGPECRVNSDVQNLVKAMHKAGKPIGAICISPALIAKIFEGAGIKLTIGNDEGTAGAIEKLGHSHVSCPVERTCIDEANKIITAPAYMYDAEVKDVFKGIDELVAEVLNRT